MSPTPAARLATLSDDYWQGALRAFPILATAIGDRRYDALLDDPSPEAIDAYRSRLAESRREVEGLDPNELSEIDRVTRSALLAQIDADDALLGPG